MAKMTKAEAVKWVRSKTPDWFAEADQPDDPNFDEFLRWLKIRCPDILAFRSTMGPYEDLEREFASVLKQGWRY